MVDVAKVKMFGMNVGTFRWDSSYEVARFEYDAQFAGKGIEPSPLMMPVQQGRIYSFGNLNREFFPCFCGCLCFSRRSEDNRSCYGRGRYFSICCNQGWCFCLFGKTGR